MTPDEAMELLRKAHQEPIAEAHFAAVRARVLSEIAAEKRAWWRRAWTFGVPVAVAAAILLAVWLKGPAARQLAVRSTGRAVAERPRAVSAPDLAQRAPQTAESPRKSPESLPETRQLTALSGRNRPPGAGEAGAGTTRAVRERGVIGQRVVSSKSKHWAVIGPPNPQPLVVKVLTSDPNVVIYWISERTGE
jgi:hypothetical protein